MRKIKVSYVMDETIEKWLTELATQDHRSKSNMLEVLISRAWKDLKEATQQTNAPADPKPAAEPTAPAQRDSA